MEPSTIFAWLGAGLVTILAFVTLLHHWQLNSVATSSDIQHAFSKVDRECRQIFRLRVQAKLTEDGQPITRGDLTKAAAGLEDCGTINDQMGALLAAQEQ